VSETFSRSELLKARGYPVETENGSTPAVGRECSICHGPVPLDRPKNSTVCEKPECREAWRLAQRRRRYADGREPPATIFELVSRTGAELVSVELVLGGERWLLTRQGQLTLTSAVPEPTSFGGRGRLNQVGRHRPSVCPYVTASLLISLFSGAERGVSRS
jgi:hypothetical protein